MNGMVFGFGACDYDDNGNLTDSHNGARTYVYDDENRLMELYYISGFPAKAAEFVYDGLGRLRIRREYEYAESLIERSWSLQSETRYIYDGWRVIQERNGSGTPTVSYTRGTDLSGSLEGAGGIGGLLARSHDYSGGAWSTHNFYHADGNGNITYLVNSSQTLAASYRYDPYGNTISSSGTLANGNVYRFSSKEVHTLSGLYYYGYRFYEPNFQRWLNSDPITENGFVQITLQNTNALVLQVRWGASKPAYVFAGNSPEVYVDPFGLDITPTGTVTLSPNCTKPIFTISDDDPKNRWKWVPYPSGGTGVPTDGIGWWGPDGKQYGWKIPNANTCTIICNSKGYPSGVPNCSKWPGASDCRRWKPGGGPPDNLPPVPGEGTWD